MSDTPKFYDITIAELRDITQEDVDALVEHQKAFEKLRESIKIAMEPSLDRMIDASSRLLNYWGPHP